MLQLVSGVVDCTSNKALHSLLASPDQRQPFPLLYGLIAFNGCLSSLPFINAFHYCLSSMPFIAMTSKLV
jgi:hypothetical protein